MFLILPLLIFSSCYIRTIIPQSLYTLGGRGTGGKGRRERRMEVVRVSDVMGNVVSGVQANVVYNGSTFQRVASPSDRGGTGETARARRITNVTPGQMNERSTPFEVNLDSRNINSNARYFVIRIAQSW